MLNRSRSIFCSWINLLPATISLASVTRSTSVFSRARYAFHHADRGSRRGSKIRRRRRRFSGECGCSDRPVSGLLLDLSVDHRDHRLQSSSRVSGARTSSTRASISVAAWMFLAAPIQSHVACPPDEIIPINGVTWNNKILNRVSEDLLDYFIMSRCRQLAHDLLDDSFEIHADPAGRIRCKPNINANAECRLGYVLCGVFGPFDLRCFVSAPVSRDSPKGVLELDLPARKHF